MTAWKLLVEYPAYGHEISVANTYDYTDVALCDLLSSMPCEL